MQHWILFYVQDGETRKSVLRQHQRRAIDAILARCADSGKTRGLVWHTQGSGKTFTLLTVARQILEDKARFNNAIVLLVVDRTELEGQLKGWVERLLGEMQTQDIVVKRASNKAELQALLDADFRGLIISLKERAERILKDLEDRKTTGLAAMDQLAALAAEKEAAMKAARDSGLSARAFSVFWVLREDAAMKAADLDAMALAKDIEELLGRFPNAQVNHDEQRRLRAALYKPLLGLPLEERARVVDLVLKLLLAEADE
ncbi:MAG: DEAD/DEAH box helicase family protein [Azoarcus sp.]|nr:DEAD/DEAH box helicase family protein [Azoarcus sp.]